MSLSSLSVLLGTVFVIGGAANTCRVYCFSRAGHNVVRRIRQELFDSITKQETEFFDRTSTGELVNRLSSDTTLMGESFGGLQLAAMLRNLAQFVGAFGVMVYLSPELSKVMCALIPLGITGSILFGRFVRSTQEAVQRALSDSTSVAEEKLLNIRTVRSFANEIQERKRYHQQVFHIIYLFIYLF
ncbi:ATP-binding cassette, sub-family B (MDR/TAP), member 10 [Reticulomyxa filosa]|uniref:ATP-binding cassette, sub-family B (MDR/TAP), member 10 n=1 Tax=Reticulomyxa filosa TaxID=46433 RepID=X6MEJ6_RETFI|nr:ATP-binding cassette, sub-family B (MDR/TAP), member 10 [Reticulomyxa filosa]|eukprot:ETO12096.1 ATP-binding cassette, sub-family B (MDR/TAP), member 10 [Reticulomyxa filosa]